MPGRYRVPLPAVALVLFGLIALLGTLQYRWLGQISEAERGRMRESLTASAEALARDVDAELTRAYLLFQTAPPTDDDVTQLAAQYDRWQAASRFPRVIASIYRVTFDAPAPALRRFDPATRTLSAADWPETMRDGQSRFATAVATSPASSPSIIVRRLPDPVWESVPALVVPAARLGLPAGRRPPDLSAAARFAYTVLVIDSAYLSAEMLPGLVAEHFRQPDDAGIRVAVVGGGDARPVIYRSGSGWTLDESGADVAVGLFGIRTGDFERVASEVHRITTLATTFRFDASLGSQPSSPRRDPLAIFVQREQEDAGSGATARDVTAHGGSAPGSLTATRITATTSPAWRLLVQHPSGSLETAVATARRRNLFVSSSILLMLGASLGLLVLSTRRAQRLARQQMEFVATVSHELRTPLAVIRSAADNLADGVVHDEARIRTYGEVMRAEGRRLTEMVEQILEFAGMASGQRALRRATVALGPLLGEVVEASLAAAGNPGVRVDVAVPHDLPAVTGDAQALRRVFQNLVGNALKYGAAGGWVGVSATAQGREVRVTVADRGIGIEPAEQARIFEPFYRAPAVQAAQVQGAGLGLSLVRRIVSAHGGRVGVESAAGAGAAFTVHLAAAGPAPAGLADRAGVADADAPGVP